MHTICTDAEPPHVQGLSRTDASCLQASLRCRTKMEAKNCGTITNQILTGGLFFSFTSERPEVRHVDVNIEIGHAACRSAAWLLSRELMLQIYQAWGLAVLEIDPKGVQCEADTKYLSGDPGCPTLGWGPVRFSMYRAIRNQRSANGDPGELWI